MFNARAGWRSPIEPIEPIPLISEYNESTGVYLELFEPTDKIGIWAKVTNDYETRWYYVGSIDEAYSIAPMAMPVYIDNMAN